MFRNLKRLAALIWAFLFWAEDAFAMHISEGILPFGWAVFWYILSIPFLAYGIHLIRKRAHEIWWKPLLGLSAALVFVISCMPIPVPIAGTCSHPCGTAISAILLGPFVSVVVAFCALLLQALFLAHGGLSTLGANTISMGVAGSFGGYFLFKFLRAFGARLSLAGFFAGLFADWATYTATSFELSLGIRGEAEFWPLFSKIMVAFIPTQLPLGILEGAITAGVVVLVSQKRPDILRSLGLLRLGEVKA
ncbi:MAG: energy-coupling factor ABC transporter permease [Desulfatiglandales bacterium]